MPVIHTELTEGIDQLVGNPTIVDLYRAWTTAAEEGGLPGLDRFDPASCGDLAGNLMLLEPGQQAFRYAYYGARIAMVSHQDMTGRYTSEFPGEMGEFFERTYRRALASGRPLYTVHHSSRQSTPITWERLALPVLAADGRQMIVCYTAPIDRRAELFDGLLAASMDGITVMEPVLQDGVIVDFIYLMVNQRAGLILDRAPESLIGQPLTAHFPNVEERLTAYREVMRTGVPRQFEVDTALDGRRRVFRLAAARTGNKLVVTLSDVTVLHEALERLEMQQTELRFANDTLQDQAGNLVALVETTEQARAEAWAAERFVTGLMETVPIPLFHWNLDGTIARANGNYAAVYGMTREAIIGKRPEDLLSPEQAAVIYRKNAELLGAGDDRQVYEGDVRSTHGSRHYVVHRALMRDAAGQPSGITGAMLDVTEEYELRKRLEILAATDPLTGLNNRRVFMERLDAELSRFRRYDRPVSVVQIDIDHFKAANDTHGHDFGDRVLIGLARILKEGVRDSIDLPARLGGEEFAILLPDTHSGNAAVLAERLRTRFATSAFPAPTGAQFYTASFGVAEAGAGDDISRLFKRADDALYSSKRHGRNQVTVADLPLRGHARA